MMDTEHHLRRILVAHSEAVVVDAIARFLESEGFRVAKADAEADPIAILRATHADALVCEGGDFGDDSLVARVKRQPTMAHLPIVALAGDEHPEAPFAGVVVLRTPVRLHELAAATRTVCSRGVA
jgi:CheY-like chemotaxis protein